MGAFEIKETKAYYSGKAEKARSDYAKNAWKAAIASERAAAIENARTIDSPFAEEFERLVSLRASEEDSDA